MKVKKAFTQLSNVEFGPKYMESKDYKDQIEFGLYYKDNSVEGGSIRVRWYHEEGIQLLEPVMTIHGDAFQLVSGFKTILGKLGKTYIQPNHFAQVLMESGFTEMSKEF